LRRLRAAQPLARSPFKTHRSTRVPLIECAHHGTPESGFDFEPLLGSFHGSWIESAFPVYSMVLSGLATGVTPEPCPTDTQMTLICMLGGISG